MTQRKGAQVTYSHRRRNAPDGEPILRSLAHFPNCNGVRYHTLRHEKVRFQTTRQLPVMAQPGLRVRALESTVWCLGIEVGDALVLSEQADL